MSTFRNLIEIPSMKVGQQQGHIFTYVCAISNYQIRRIEFTTSFVKDCANFCKNDFKHVKK